jgi:5-carboxymethyl-2-hydroxymuconate isomerase
MPHVIVEYSANIEKEITPQRLVEEIHAAAIASGIAEPVAVRTRLKRREHFRVGDGSPDNAFVHIDVRARKGRSLEQKKHAVQTIYDQANKTLEPVFKARPLAPRDRSGDAAVAQRHARAAGQRRVSTVA